MTCPWCGFVMQPDDEHGKLVGGVESSAVDCRVTMPVVTPTLLGRVTDAGPSVPAELLCGCKPALNFLCHYHETQIWAHSRPPVRP